ncbi:MAG TPA: GNAT family N-acetyltransferase [Streptosporangiaceae bacterium]|nr:GNAT family N-acetyltransferase [Streptosporangiaceae bacterium]
MIRPARRADVPAIYRLIEDLARYERALPEVTGTEQDLTAALFGPEPAVFAHVAENEGQVAGFALWYLSFSTWQGRHGIYLEDLYVEPALRGRGYGRRLVAELAALCLERGYGRLEWSVLDWNSPALGFYATLGATPMAEWTVHRLTGPALGAVAAGDGADAQPD